MDGHRRSSRSRKKVDYSKLSESSDDDFKEKDAPVTKKKKKKAENSEKSTSESKGKKSERKEAKHASSDVSPRPARSEKLVLQKDVKVSLQALQENRRPEKITESENDASNDEDDKGNIIEEQKEDTCTTKQSSRTVQKGSNSEVDVEEDEDYAISDEEEEEVDDQEEWKESSDGSEDRKRKSSRKSKAEAKKVTEEKAVPNKSNPVTRQAKKEGSRNYSTPKGKVVNYCSRQPSNLPAVKLRLGLSRKAVTKPLHPVVKIQQ